jgi:hypothetical protein
MLAKFGDRIVLVSDGCGDDNIIDETRATHPLDLVLEQRLAADLL